MVTVPSPSLPGSPPPPSSPLLPSSTAKAIDEVTPSTVTARL